MRSWIRRAGRQVASAQQLHHLALRERHLFGRFQHERITGGDGERQEPHRHHRREIEGRDRRAHAERLAHHVTVDAGRDVLEAEALHQRRRAARHFDALDAATHAAARLVEGLAMFGGDDARHLLEMFLEQRLEPVEHLRACVDRRIPPGRERLGRGLHRRVNVSAGRQRRPSNDVADRRVVHVEKLSGAGVDPPPADEIVENLNV